jgi:uncharacterized cupin superfamily protein
MPDEASFTETPAGLAPASEGWFVVNVREAAWYTSEELGAACRFESSEARFGQLGVNIRVLQPGQANARYHQESVQEDSLVLTGECLLLVEEEERCLKPWDLVHCPPQTGHVFIGAGDGPCAILMVGARTPDRSLLYPVSPVALRHGVGVESETADRAQAYANVKRPTPGNPPRWDELPWGRGEV